MTDIDELKLLIERYPAFGSLIEEVMWENIMVEFDILDNPETTETEQIHTDAHEKYERLYKAGIEEQMLYLQSRKITTIQSYLNHIKERLKNNRPTDMYIKEVDKDF